MNNLTLTNAPSIDDIMSAVSFTFECSNEDIISRLRTEDIRIARGVFCYLVRKFHPKLTLFSIGIILSDREHTTIMSSIGRVKGFLDIKDKYLTQKINAIYTKLPCQNIAA